MQTEYSIVDNFLPEENFKLIKHVMLESLNFPWYVQDHIVDDSEENSNSNLFFGHIVYHNYTQRSQFFDLISPIIEKLNAIALIRIKCNLYPNVGEFIEHKMHQDQPYPHKGAVFHINSNNGYTILEDGTKIESIENRMVFLNSFKPHRSTTCTNELYRVNININYI